jgi:hypothetical protein
MRWDRERVTKIIDKMLDDARRRGIYQTDECINELENLLGEVRNEAMGYTWTEACSQYDKGMDPRNFTIPTLIAKANADLNPEKE